MEQKKVQESYKGLPLNVMAYSQEIFDALNSTEATIKISALFNYLGPGPESDITKRENLIQFAKKCATRKIVNKIKSYSGVEETEEAYNKRISQEVYNTAKITEKIRVGIDEKEEIHFYVKFGKDKNEYEINMEDTLRVIGEIYQQIMISQNEKNMRQAEEEKAKIEIEFQQILAEKEKIIKQAEEERAKREAEFQAQILELAQKLEQEKEKNAEVQKKLAETQNQYEEAKKQSLPKKIDVVKADEKDDETGTTLSNSEKEAIAKALKIEYNDQNLSISTISHICDAVLKFAAHDFKRLTKADRQERRAVNNDLRKYIELWDTYAHQLEDIIEKSQKEVLRVLNISDDDWENSNASYMKTNNHELLMIHASLPQKLKMSMIVGDKTLDEIKFKEILRAQTKLLNKEAENLDEIRQYVTHEEEIAPIVQNRVNDKIFETYSVEEEHIYGSIRAHMMDLEVQEIFKQLQEITMRLVPMQGDPEREKIKLEIEQDLFDSQQENTLLREEKTFREKELEEENAKLQADIQDLKSNFMQAILENHQQGDNPLKVFLEQLKLQSQ